MDYYNELMSQLRGHTSENSKYIIVICNTRYSFSRFCNNLGFNGVMYNDSKFKGNDGNTYLYFRYGSKINDIKGMLFKEYIFYTI